MSKKQTCVSHSTPEAEIVAADMVLRTIGLPALQLWDILLGKGEGNLKAIFKEDNEAAIKILMSGKNSQCDTCNVHMVLTWRGDANSLIISRSWTIAPQSVCPPTSSPNTSPTKPNGP